MSAQPITSAGRVRHTDYQQLLVERIALGRRMMDAFCHQLLDHHGTRPLWQDLARVDAALAASPDYSDDFIKVVVEAEQDRWHAAGERPVDMTTDPCLWCLLRDTARNAVVVPQQPRPAR